jgi:plasmid maintenance system antidote protein VapI
MDEQPTIRYSGMDLKLRRVAADVRVTEVADAMGVTISRITYIEGRRVVTPRAAARYLDALRKSTEGAA